MRALSLALATFVSGCVGLPNEGEIVIEVTPRDEAPKADGHGQAELRITVDEASEVFRREIYVEVSTGTIGGPNDPSRLRLRTPPGRVVELPWRYGTQPGRGTVQVRVADYTVIDGSLILAPQLPERISLSTAQPVLDGDGRSQSQLSVAIGMRAPERSPSEGTVVHLTACCSVDGAPAECDVAPFSVPGLVRVALPGPAQVSVTAARLDPVIDDEGPVSVLGFVLAAADAPPTCTSTDDAAIGRQALEIVAPRAF